MNNSSLELGAGTQEETVRHLLCLGGVLKHCASRGSQLKRFDVGAPQEEYVLSTAVTRQAFCTSANAYFLKRRLPFVPPHTPVLLRSIPGPSKEQIARACADWQTGLKPSLIWLQSPERASALDTSFLCLTDSSRAAERRPRRSGTGQPGVTS